MACFLRGNDTESKGVGNTKGYLAVSNKFKAMVILFNDASEPEKHAYIQEAKGVRGDGVGLPIDRGLSHVLKNVTLTESAR